MRPRQRVHLVAAAAALAAACGAKAPNLTPSYPSGKALVVLLPDADGTVGRAIVTTPSASRDLSGARESIRAVAGQPLAAATMSEQEVGRIFGDALTALPPVPKHFTLYFQFESDGQLTDESRALVPEIQKAVSERQSPDIIVVGHTDTMGTPAANYELGLRRARFVRSLLGSSGLDAAAIEVTSLGESDLLIKTADETPEPRNRRVEIAVR